MSGRVTDPTGASVPGATVTAVNLADNTKFRSVSDASGYYVLPYLPLGPYKLTVEKAGFQTMVREGLDIHVNDVLALDISLSVGEVTASVTVNAESPLLTPDMASLGQVVSNRVVSDLPLNGRNPFILQQLVAGVTPLGQSAGALNRPWDTNTVSDISVSGAPGRANMLTLNGVYAKGGNEVSFTPSVEAVQEFKVQKNTYDAEYGHVAGGTFNVATKSGTKEFHGSLYEFLRNSALDSNNYFAEKAGSPQPLFRMNQFGATMGGPVRLPHYPKDKTFFFFNYEGVRQGTPPQTGFTTVPTDAQRAGDFSKTLFSDGRLITVYDPLTTRSDPDHPGQYIRTPFTNNMVPAVRINPISTNVMKYIPGPNRTGLPVTGVNNYVFQGGGAQNYDQYGTRIDHNFNDRSRIFGMVGISNYTEDFANMFNNLATAQSRIQNTREAILDYVYTFSPTLLGNVRYGYARKWENTLMGSAGFNPVSLGFPQSLVSQFPYLNFPQFQVGDAGGTLGHSGPSYNASDGHNLTAILTRTAGRHTMKAGTYLLLQLENDDRGGGNGSSGIYSFGRNWTQADPFTSSSYSGYGTATFLLGFPSSGQVGQGGYQASRTTFYEFFFQDDIKVTSRLALNLGLRWEYQGATTDRYNRLYRTFDFNTVLPIAAAAQAAYAQNPIPQVSPADFKVRGGSIFAAANGAPRAQLDPERSNFGPRVGLAYQVSNHMVWRVGFGVFYNPRLSGINMRGFDAVSPMLTSLDGLTPLRNISNPFPNGLVKPVGASGSKTALIGQDANFTNPQITTPKVTNWSTGFQYELPQHVLIDASYVGSIANRWNPNWAFNSFDAKYLALGSGLYQNVPNPFFGLIPTSAGSLGQPTIQLQQLLRPFPAYNSVNSGIVGTGETVYHSAQISAERRFENGFTFLASYTLSKLMDRSAFMNPGYSNVYESTISDYDRPQRFVLSGVWELPFGKGKRLGDNIKGIAGKLVSGWQINNITTLQRGQALKAPGGAIATGISAAVPNPTIDQWFNTKAFAVQPPFTLRTLTRNLAVVRMDGINNWDLSMIKNTKVTERVTVQFRAEFFNVFNHVQWGNPNTDVTSSTFGQVFSQANTPRQIQFGIKLGF
jgi:hypothetical protein